MLPLPLATPPSTSHMPFDPLLQSIPLDSESQKAGIEQNGRHPDVLLESPYKSKLDK